MAENEDSPSKLWCLCLKPSGNNRGMIQCFKCCNWYHFSCVGITKKKAALLYDWGCSTCTRMEAVVVNPLKTVITESISELYHGASAATLLVIEETLKSLSDSNRKLNDEVLEMKRLVTRQNGVLEDLQKKPQENDRSSKDLEDVKVLLARQNEVLEDLQKKLKGSDKKRKSISLSPQTVMVKDNKKVRKYIDSDEDNFYVDASASSSQPLQIKTNKKVQKATATGSHLKLFKTKDYLLHGSPSNFSLCQSVKVNGNTKVKRYIDDSDEDEDKFHIETSSRSQPVKVKLNKNVQRTIDESGTEEFSRNISSSSSSSGAKKKKSLSLSQRKVSK